MKRYKTSAWVLPVFSIFLLFLPIFCAYRPDPMISERDLAYYVKTLASDDMKGRESGTIYSEKAADFIADQYRQLGLFQAFQKSYFQPFEFPAGAEVIPDENTFRWRPAGALLVKPSGERAGKHTPIPLAEPGTYTGKLIFLGFCLKTGDGSWNDYQGVDVKNKILLCLRYGPGGRDNKKIFKFMTFEKKYDQAKKEGAQAVLFLGRAGAPDISANDFPFKNRSGPGAAFVQPDLFLDTLPAIREEEKKMLAGKRSRLNGAALGEIVIRSAYKPKMARGRNVGAYLREFSKNQRVFILGAHYDHIGMGHFSSIRGKGEVHNGADDNASGTAVVLEAAGELKARESKSGNANDWKLPKEYNILFLNFDAEERGLCGSESFANSAFFPGKNAVLMMNFDMVGRLRETKGLSIQGKGKDKELKQVIEKAFKNTYFPPEFKLNDSEGSYDPPSDHSSFLAKETPAIFFHTGIHDEYHTPKDDFEQINVPGLFLTANLALNLIKEITFAEKPLTFKKPAARRKRKMRCH